MVISKLFQETRARPTSLFHDYICNNNGGQSQIYAVQVQCGGADGPFAAARVHTATSHGGGTGQQQQTVDPMISSCKHALQSLYRVWEFASFHKSAKSANSPSQWEM